MNVVIECNITTEVSFKVYTPLEQIVKKIDNENQANRTSPEGLVQSFFSASNSKWVKDDYLEPERANDSRNEKHFNRVKAMDKEKNFVKLMDKYTFEINGVSVTYVFYTIEMEGVDFKFPTVLSCYKKEGRWYVYNLPNQAKLREILMMFKPEILKIIINGGEGLEPKFIEVVSKTRGQNNSLSIEKLYNEYKSWTQSKNSEMLKYFTNI